MKKFVYFYFMKDMPDKIKGHIESHINYWKAVDLSDYEGGPFSDRSGGLIVFCNHTIESANEIIRNDPFIMNDLIADRWIKEWIVG